MNIDPSLPAYTVQGFVNRKDEIDLVLQRLDDLINGRYVEKRTIIFTGQHGIGKSWFLLHLYTLFQQKRWVKVQLVNLGAYPPTLSPQDVLLQIVAKISNELLTNVPIPHTSPDTATAALLRAIKAQILDEKHVLVILLDTVYESPRPLLALLEDYLLGPLAIENNVLMIFAGRGREYAWMTPELRLQADFYTLALFAEGTTAEQLQIHRQDAFGRARTIHALSLGNPKTTLLLAQSGNPAAVLDQVIDEMLLPIDHPDQRLMREHLEALAIVRGFDYSHMPVLLSAYYDDATQHTLSRRELREILDRLLAPGLVYWNTARLAYTLHEAMRHLICLYLRQAKFERWHKLHESAIALYEEWVASSSTNPKQWQDELAYHRQELEQA